MKKLFLLLMLSAGFAFYSSRLNAMSMKAEHDLFSQSAQEQISGNFKNQIQEIIPNKFYVAKIKDKPLYAVMERVTDENIEVWKNYITIQTSSRALEFTPKNFSGDGSRHFAKVLSETSHDANEMWIAYLTSNDHPVYDPYKFSTYNQQKMIDRNHTIAKNIKMFVTITSHENALITSHMGVSKTLETVFGKEQYKDISMDLHSFGAKFMLMRDARKKLMINAPAAVMETIIAKNLPENAVFIGTKEMVKSINKDKNSTFEDCLSLKAFKEFDEDAQATLNDWKEYLEEDGDTKTFKSFERNTVAQKYLERDNDTFAISADKVLKIKKDYFEKYILHDFSYLAEILKMPHKDFYTFLEKHPALISVDSDGGIHPENRITVLNPKNPDSILIDITKNNPDYNWLFTNPFLPAGVCHYVAVDLSALANCRELE